MGRRWIKGLLVLLLGTAIALTLAALAALKALTPQPGEWSRIVSFGPFSRELSMPALLRIGLHPFTLRLLEGRDLKTSAGVVQWRAGPTAGSWVGVCTPCRLNPGLGREPLRLARVEFTVVPDAEMNLQGDFTLGEGEASQRVHGHWDSRLERTQLVLRFTLRDQPLANAFGLFPSDIPELGRARIAGRLSASARLVLPSREFSVTPRLEGFAVAGLGTEALLNARPACEAADPEASLGVWLPRAVIAAEDQGYAEHTGYEVGEMVKAWTQNRRAATEGQAVDAPLGASTLPQQLAKLLYTGDSRHHGRKLRELLYAVELDRTLGKARLLHLYLSLVPWGDGRCGAQAASLHLLGKPAESLTPMEAVWLASLLHNPDRELAQLSRRGQVNTERVTWVADQLRPSPLRNRERWAAQAERWVPPPVAFKAAMGVAASQASSGH